jgi:osmoprotectant transport system permease protein
VTFLAVASDTSCLVDNAWICAEYLQTRQSELFAATGQHLKITVASVALGLVLALPLALLARRYRRAEAGVLGVATGLYTIPSLALFSLLLPFTGLGEDTVIVGMALYSLTILVRNVIAGLDGVPGDVVEAARGMGYGAMRMLARVELPLALPAIMAGVRVATVSTVALTTVGAIVGAGGLGTLLYEAFPSQFKAQILSASLLCVLLAIALDVALLGAQRLMTPWVARGQGR